MDRLGHTSSVIKKYLPFVASVLAGIGFFLQLTITADSSLLNNMRENSAIIMIASFFLSFIDMIGEPVVKIRNIVHRSVHIVGVAVLTAIAIMCSTADGPIYANVMGTVIMVMFVYGYFTLIHNDRIKWISPMPTP
jgi:hypothetical protein